MFPAMMPPIASAPWFGHVLSSPMVPVAPELLYATEFETTKIDGLPSSAYWYSIQMCRYPAVVAVSAGASAPASPALREPHPTEAPPEALVSLPPGVPNP